MATISKIQVGSTVYDIEDTVARNSGGGLTNDAKQALLALLRKVAYIDANGQTYYDALEDALYPPADLVSISAVYTQSGTVYDTDSLDSLKADLVVTAHWSDLTTSTVASTDYTLSGTLAEGTSTITVAYGGYTTTFNVTVTQADDNILLNTTITTGKYLKTNDGGVANSSSGEFVTDEFNISNYAGQIVLFSFLGAAYSQDAYRVCFYDSSHTFISCSYTGHPRFSFTVPSTAIYARLGGKYANLTGITIGVAKNSITSENKVSGSYYTMEDGSLVNDGNYTHALLDIGSCRAIVVDCSSFVSFDESQNFLSASSGNHLSGYIYPSGSAVYVGMNIQNSKLATATVYGTVDYLIGNLVYTA